MAIDPYDPLNIENALTRSNQRRQQRRASQTMLTPQEEQSLLERLGRVGMGGLEIGGGILDTPGSSVRALLAGRLEASLSGVTNWDDRVSGRDVLESWGVVGRNKTGFGGNRGWSNIDWGDAAGDLAGFATEIATDPLSYVGIGALTRAGQLAKLGGTGTKGFVSSIRNNERALLSLGVPLTGKTLDFTGPAAAKVASGIGSIAGAPIKATDKALGALGYDQPISSSLDYLRRIGSAALDPDVGGKIGAAEQDFQRRLSESRRATEFAREIAPRHAAEWMKQGLDAVKAADPALAQQWGAGDYDQFGAMVRLASERDVDTAVNVLAGGNMTPQAKAALQETVDKLKQQRDDPFSRALGVGASGEYMDDSLVNANSHFPRQTDLEKLTGKPQPKGQGGQYGSRFAKSREDAIRNVPEKIANEITADPNIRNQGANEIKAKWGQWLSPNYGEEVKIINGQPVVIVQGSADKHAEALAQWVKTVPEGELFNRSALTDQVHYTRNMSLRASHIEAAQDFVVNSIDPQGTYTLGQFYEEMPGFDKDRALEYVAKRLNLNPNQAAALKISEETARIVESGMKMVNPDPSVQSELAKLYDWWINKTKFLQTVPFPKFHATNLLGGQYLNVASGLMSTPRDLGEYTRAVKDVVAGNIDEATKAELSAFNVLGGSITEGLDERMAEDLVSAGVVHEHAAMGVELDPRRQAQRRAQRGLGGKVLDRTGAQAYLDAMSKAGRFIERVNRAPLYVYLKRKAAREGKPFDPVEAARIVGERQLDYTRATPFERQALKRIFPYWAWIRGSSELVFKNVAQQPGGLMAQTVRGTNLARDESEGLPGYMKDRTAIPVPGMDSRFITNIGLPTDDVFSRFSVGADAADTAQRGLEHLLGMSSPALSVPYTLASGRQPFFGREIRDMFPYPSDSPATNALLTGLPGSRFLTVARQAQDERKSWGDFAFNQLSPASMTDVSGGVEYQKAREQFDAVNELLKVSPSTRSYERYYTPEGVNDPEAQKLLELSNILRKRMHAVKEE